MSGRLSLALLEVSNLSPSLIVADRCSKAAGVHLVGIESTDGAGQCIKLSGSIGDVQHAVDAGVALAETMGASATASIIPAPLDETRILADPEPAFIPALGNFDNRIPDGNGRSRTILAPRSGIKANVADKDSPDTAEVDSEETNMSQVSALGLLETQGLVAALHATDDMLKSANVELVGKEKIGAAYVTIMIRGDVAAVQNAIETGKATVERLGGKLILSDVIARPHGELAALLPD